MGLYRKKPVVVEARRFPGPANIVAMLEFDDWLSRKAQKAGIVCRYTGPSLIIPTLEGDMTASRGDWVICGVKGELYPCKPDIFEATYVVAD